MCYNFYGGSMRIVAQLFGLFALITWNVSVQLKDKKRVMAYQTIANFSYGLQYIFLGAITAGLMNFISVVRCFLLFEQEKKKEKPSKKMFYIFSLIIIIIGFLTYKDITSLIPVLISLLYTYSVFQSDMKVFRIIFFIGGICWLSYNILVGAYVSVFGNVIEILSGLTAIIRYDIKKKKALN